MQMREASTAVRFSSGSFNLTTSRRLSPYGSFSISWNKLKKLPDMTKNRVRASAEEAASHIQINGRPSWYHPLEEFSDSELMEGGEARLTPAETTRTIVEVNSSATLIFSGLLSTEEQENIFWPDLPYVTDEHGNIYFQVKNDEDILHSLTAEDNFVQVIIGLDTTELQSEIGVSGPSEIEFGINEIDDEDTDASHEVEDVDDNEDSEDDEDEDWVSILENEEDLDDDESLGDWAELETMRTSHPMYFAKKLAEVVSDDPIDFMNQPPAGLIILGLLRPAFIDENSVIHKHKSGHDFGEPDMDRVNRKEPEKVEGIGYINGQSSQDSSTWGTEFEKGGTLGKGTAFYKLEMINIQLISAHGHQTLVEVEKLRKTTPDAIAHTAAKILSRLKTGGEKTAQALKSLCWRCKGIKAEEATIIGVDSLGFDLRVCSGKQLQTLRFTFSSRASSEYSAERQLNDQLFPRTHHCLQKQKEAHQTEL